MIQKKKVFRKSSLMNINHNLKKEDPKRKVGVKVGKKENKKSLQFMKMWLKIRVR